MNKSIYSETDYSPEYRFRLWVALVDDMALLGMGHRAYHSHVMRSFQEWSRLGYDFLNPRGHELNLEELTWEDVFGFTGKKSERPIGPARKINVLKFSVLDVFFKAKYPKIALAFYDDHILESLATVGRMFFSKPISEQETDPISLHNEGFAQAADGIYLRGSAIIAGQSDHGYLSAFIISVTPNKPYLKIKKLLFPIEDKCIKNSSKENDNGVEQYFGYNNSRIIIFEGVGFITARQVADNHFAIVCVLRESVQYTPYTVTLEHSIFYWDPEGDRLMSMDRITEASSHFLDLVWHEESNCYRRSVDIEGCYTRVNNFEDIYENTIKDEEIWLEESFIRYIYEFCDKIYMELKQ